MELLDIVDEYGNPTGNVVDREEAHAKGLLHRTSHLWIFRVKNGKLQVLLQKRCESKDSFPGCFDISSAGHIPAGKDYEESALRELKEELGAGAKEDDLIYAGARTISWDDVFHGKEYHDRQYSKVFCIFLDEDEEMFRLQKEEVESVLWMDVDAAIKGIKENAFKNCIEIEELMMAVRAAETEMNKKSE